MKNRIYLATLIFLLGVVTSTLLIFRSFNKDAYKLPDRFDEMIQIKYTGGEEAIEEIKRMHLGTISNIVRGSVAVYKGFDDGFSYLWVAEAKDDHKAKEWLESMSLKIGYDYGFTPPEALTMKNKQTLTVYHVEGYGMCHYYFIKNNRLYWIAFDNVSHSKQLELVETITLALN